MKKGIMRIIILIGLITFVSGSSPMWAEEESPTASADVSILSKYVWRGYELSADSLVIQPSATVSYKGFGFNLWGNLDTSLDDDGNPATEDNNQFTETDMTFSYDTSYGPWSIGVGYIYYEVDGDLDTSELYLSTGYDTLLSPSLTIYRDIGTLPGWYLNLSLGHSFKLTETLNLDISGSVGYASTDDDSVVEIDDTMTPTTKKYSGLHDAALSASVTIPINEYMSLTPMVAYSFPLSDKADNLIKFNSIKNDSDFIYGGVTLSIAF